jgi:hypothetical protein
MAIELMVLPQVLPRSGFMGPRFTNLEDASLSSLAKARRRFGETMVKKMETVVSSILL